MRLSLTVVLLLIMTLFCHAQNPVGKWKKIKHTIVFEGKMMDMHAALLSQRPCASKIIYEINTDQTFRLNASQSNCDESYRNIQQKLYQKTMWKLDGNRFTTSATGFAVGQTYTINITGNTMTWVGTDDQGTLVFERL